ncbi:hypothetical protein B566_EDAN005742 [Ephemera danica]|nr:hypothetical protein B566_EDAN005742 [Ephemera danica]
MRSRFIRYLLTLILPSSLLCLGFIALLYYGEADRVREHMVAAEDLRLSAGAGSLARDVGLVASDIRLLAALPSLAVALDSGGEAELKRVTADFSVLLGSRRAYYKLRWIDESGMERVRVDYLQSRVHVVPAEQLQDKAQRYFFTEAMALRASEIYVSPLDLNVEQGVIETPFRPVVRLAMRVWDSAGRPRGIVVANYFGHYLLDAFAAATSSAESGAAVSLLNREGYWLKAPQAADEWGFMFGRSEHFGTRHPEVWQRILAGEEGQFEDDDALWSFKTVHPLQGGGPAHVLGADQRRSEEYAWKVVSLVPVQDLRQTANRSLGGWILISLMFLGTLSAGSLVLARANQRRDAMSENLRTLNRELEEKIHARTEELRQQAIRDPLTGLFNRRYLNETLPREIHRAMRDQTSLAVVMIDLDHFKRFNDEWGHEAGDAVLTGAAKILFDGLRASDIACRYGGEELLLVMPGADIAEAVRRVTVISGEMRRLATRVKGRDLPAITFSAGVATLPTHGDKAETLIRAADRALYMAKETGRDRIVVAHQPGSVE